MVCWRLAPKWSRWTRTVESQMRKFTEKIAPRNLVTGGDPIVLRGLDLDEYRKFVQGLSDDELKRGKNHPNLREIPKNRSFWAGGIVIAISNDVHLKTLDESLTLRYVIRADQADPMVSPARLPKNLVFLVNIRSEWGCSCEFDLAALWRSSWQCCCIVFSPEAGSQP
jgi:hypothetical protein